MTIYLIKHEYSIEEIGECCDRVVDCEEIVTAFTKKEDANSFVEYYADEHVYYTTYEGEELISGKLVIVPKEVETEFSKKWIRCGGDYTPNWFKKKVEEEP